MQDDIKTLYSLIKGFISKKEANQNKQKVPSENSGIIAGNKHSLENSSYISFPTLKDNDLDGKELYENLPTLLSYFRKTCDFFGAETISGRRTICFPVDRVS